LVRKEKELKDWKESEVMLVDKNFNLHLQEDDPRVVKKLTNNKLTKFFSNKGIFLYFGPRSASTGTNTFNL